MQFLKDGVQTVTVSKTQNSAACSFTAKATSRYLFQLLFWAGVNAFLTRWYPAESLSWVLNGAGFHSQVWQEMDPRRTTGTQATKVLTNTNTLLVKNIPDNADEELLEMFFESTKKQGGGPVKNVKILGDKNIAFVEFCDRKSVETVMKKRPIKLGKTELEVQPYTPLIKGSGKINRVDLIGFAGEFTDDLVKKHLEYLSRGATPDYGPELEALVERYSRAQKQKNKYYKRL